MAQIQAALCAPDGSRGLSGINSQLFLEIVRCPVAALQCTSAKYVIAPQFGVGEKVLFSNNISRKVLEIWYLARLGWPGRVVLWCWIWCCPQLLLYEVCQVLELGDSGFGGGLGFRISRH
jgi:hypothetical protein